MSRVRHLSLPRTSLARAQARRGMTLVELLISITIVMLLMAISIPLVRYSLESDKVREASRQLNMMVAGARTRAIERGRLAGLWMQRSEANPNAVFEIYQCEAPPAYTGDFPESRVMLTDEEVVIPGTDTAYFDTSCVMAKDLVKAGDVIRFYRSSYYFVIKAVDFTGSASYSGWVKFAPAFVETPSPIVSTSFTVPFEVLGQPRKLNSTPLQLADGVVVDLRHSGIGAEGMQFAYSAGDADHVVIAFDQAGALSYLFFGVAPQDVDGPVHLLVGRLDQLEDADSTASNPLPYDSATTTPVSFDKNLVDQASLWVTIGSRNGTVTTAENAWELRPSGSPFFVNSLRRAREFAQASDAMGGL